FDVHVAPLARIGDEILVLATAGQHLLAIGDLLDGQELVAVPGSVLEVEPIGGARHPLTELAGQQIRAAFPEARALVDALPVALPADASRAWAWAAADVKVEASLALLEDVVRAGSERQQLADALDRAAQALGARVRTEVEGAVLEDAARVVDARELLG